MASKSVLIHLMWKWSNIRGAPVFGGSSRRRGVVPRVEYSRGQIARTMGCAPRRFLAYEQ
jgi:hypothetical protein